MALGGYASTFISYVAGRKSLFSPVTSGATSANAGQVVGLNSNGDIDISMLPVGPISMPINPSVTGYPRVLNALTANSFSSIASVANLVRFIPISVSVPTLISNLGCNVNSALAASLFIVGIYADANGPGQAAGGPTGNPLVQTSQLSGAATGQVLGSVSITLEPGYTYWVAYVNNSTTSMKSVAAGTFSANFGYGYAGSYVSALTYANSSFALPNATGLSLSESSVVNPAILQT